MFANKKKKRAASANNDPDIITQTILSEGVTIKDGNLYGSCSISISGVFFGDVDIDGPLIVTESGNLKGDIKADEAYIYGTIEGSVGAKGKVYIYAGGRVLGDIYSASLIVEESAEFKGRCNTGIIQDTKNILNIAGSVYQREKNINQQGLSENEVAINTQQQRAF